MCDDVNIQSPVIYFRLILNLVKKVYNRMSEETLTLSHIGCVRGVFHYKVILLIRAAPYVTI